MGGAQIGLHNRTVVACWHDGRAGAIWVGAICRSAWRKPFGTPMDGARCQVAHAFRAGHRKADGGDQTVIDAPS